MRADAVRHLFGYHFAENRTLWDSVMTLSDEAFARQSPYSHGSVRDQVLHLIAVDAAWFGDLQGKPAHDPDDASVADRSLIRTHWDGVEAEMRTYLAGVTDDSLDLQPLQGEDAALWTWQVLAQVVNHGTDHRAQVLRLLNDLGVKTSSQDYIFYCYDNPLP